MALVMIIVATVAVADARPSSTGGINAIGLEVIDDVSEWEISGDFDAQDWPTLNESSSCDAVVVAVTVLITMDFESVVTSDNDMTDEGDIIIVLLPRPSERLNVRVTPKVKLEMDDECEWRKFRDSVR